MPLIISCVKLIFKITLIDPIKGMRIKLSHYYYYLLHLKLFLY